MKKNFLYIIAFLSVLVACTEETIEVGTPLTGQEVKFSVSMGNDSRTLYGQEEADGKSIKVNWVNGDKITVYGTTCAVKQSDYSVVAANSGNQNYADNLVKTGAAGIQWGSEASDFYAIYPAVDEAVEVNNGIVTINTSIRQYQNNEFKLVGNTWVGTPYIEGVEGNSMPDALMYAVTPNVSSSDYNGVVDLKFKPFSTVLKFKLNGCDFQNGMTDEVVEQTEINVSKITIHAPCPVTGSCNFTFDGATPSVTGGEFEDIVIYPKQLSFKEGQSIEFSAFSMPLPYTMDGEENLWTVEIETTNFGTHTYAIKPTSSQVLKAGEIHKVNIPSFAIKEKEISLPASNWLRWIPRNVYLSELSVPGAWYATNGDYQKTTDLAEQYQKGIRAFNIDCRITSPADRYYLGSGYSSSNTGNYLAVAGTEDASGFLSIYVNLKQGTTVLSSLQTISSQIKDDEFVYVVLTISEKPKDFSNTALGTVEPAVVMAAIQDVLDKNGKSLKVFGYRDKDKNEDGTYKTINANTTLNDVLGSMIVKVNVNVDQNKTDLSSFKMNKVLLTEGSMASSEYVSGDIVAGTFNKMNTAVLYWGSSKTNPEMNYYYHQAQHTQTDSLKTSGSAIPSLYDRKTALKDIIDQSSVIYKQNEHDGLFQLGLGGYSGTSGNENRENITQCLNRFVYNQIVDKLENSPSPIGIVLMNYCTDNYYKSVDLTNALISLNTKYFLNRNKENPEWPDGNPYNQNGEENPPT